MLCSTILRSILGTTLLTTASMLWNACGLIVHSTDKTICQYNQLPQVPHTYGFLSSINFIHDTVEATNQYLIDLGREPDFYPLAFLIRPATGGSNTPIGNNRSQDSFHALLIARLQFIALNQAFPLRHLAVLNRPIENVRSYGFQRKLCFLLSDELLNEVSEFCVGVSYSHRIIVCHIYYSSIMFSAKCF